MSGLRPLRPHQAARPRGAAQSLLSGRRRPMLQAPTGFGKTLMAAHIIRRALDKGKRVAFVVPALSLIDQTVAAFEAEGIHAIGVMQGIHPRTDREQPVQVCSRPDGRAAEAARRSISSSIDEAHQHHREIYRWMADCPQTPVHRLVGDAMGRGPGQILRRPDRRGDDERSDPRRLSLGLRGLRAERAGSGEREHRRRRLPRRRACRGDGRPDAHRRHRRDMAQARRKSPDVRFLRQSPARPARRRAVRRGWRRRGIHGRHDRSRGS